MRAFIVGESWLVKIVLTVSHVEAPICRSRPGLRVVQPQLIAQGDTLTWPGGPANCTWDDVDCVCKCP